MLFSQNYGNTDYLLNIVLIPDRFQSRHYESEPVKYERHSKYMGRNSAKSKLYLMVNLTRDALVIPFMFCVTSNWGFVMGNRGQSPNLFSTSSCTLQYFVLNFWRACWIALKRYQHLFIFYGIPPYWNNPYIWIPSKGIRLPNIQWRSCFLNQGPLLLKWIYFNPGMGKQLYPFQSVGQNYWDVGCMGRIVAF